MRISELINEATTTIAGFKPHTEQPTGYNDGKEWTGGTPIITVAGKRYSFTGKTGTNRKTGKQAFEYQHRSNGEDARVWVTVDGQVFPD